MNSLVLGDPNAYADLLSPCSSVTMTSVHRYGPEGPDSAILRTDKMWGDYAAKYWNSN